MGLPGPGPTGCDWFWGVIWKGGFHKCAVLPIISIRLELLPLYEHMNPLGILLQCGFWFSRQAAGPRGLHLQQPPGDSEVGEQGLRGWREDRRRKVLPYIQTLLAPSEVALQRKPSVRGDTDGNTHGDHIGRWFRWHGQTARQYGMVGIVAAPIQTGNHCSAPAQWYHAWTLIWYGQIFPFFKRSRKCDSDMKPPILKTLYRPNKM